MFFCHNIGLNNEYVCKIKREGFIFICIIECLNLWPNFLFSKSNLKKISQNIPNNPFHWWRSQVQFRSIFDERHELGQEIHTNARNTAGLCGLILSCCFDLIVYITKISKHWEFAPIAWLCPWRSYIILSEFVVFVENGTKLNLTSPSMILFI